MAIWKWVALAAAGLTIGSAAPAQPGGNSGGLVYPYPAESLELREEGTVFYRVRVDKKGALETCEVTRSSGFTRLDRATCDMLARYARFKPGRSDDGRRAKAVHDGKMVWKIS